MAYHSYHTLQCQCGHIGKVERSENDQPYSEMWSRYSLANLNGGVLASTEPESLHEVFEKMKPSCPKCGASLTMENVIR